MLAILLIRMEWTKESRTPKGAAERQKYYRPVPIEEDVPLTGKGIFLKKCSYHQTRESVQCDQETAAELERLFCEENKAVPFAGRREHAEIVARRRNQSVRRDKGAFYDIADIAKADLPCIAISEEPDGSYRVKWFDCGLGMPRRRGGNEDLYRPGARLAGKTSTLNETAFILHEGESGMLKYNYRMSYYDGQWYECYYVYMVNADTLTRDVFLRTYDHEYDQLADLF